MKTQFTLAATGTPGEKIGDPYEILALSANSRVLRYGKIPQSDRWGYWFLELNTDKVDLSRVEAGTAPLLFGHGWQHLGVIESGKAQKDGLHLSVRWTTLPDDPAAMTAQQKMAAELWRGVQERTRNAYSIRWDADTDKFEKIGVLGDRPIFRCLTWQLQEVSLVDIGADGSATRLSAEEATLAETLEKELRMPGDKENSTGGTDLDKTLADAKAAMKADMDKTLADAKAAMKAENQVRVLQSSGMLKDGDDVVAKLAPAFLAVPDLGDFLPKPTAPATGGKKLNQPAPGGKKTEKELSAEEILKKAKEDGVNPFSLIQDDETE